MHGDYDVDGVCATALAVEVLRLLGGEVEPFLPSRFEHGYGVAVASVEAFAAAGAGLLITVDCGIAAPEAVARARELGRFVVTDHHRPGAVLPDAPIVASRVPSGGQERLDLGAEQAQHLDAERGRAHAVDVVVAVHDDACARRRSRPRSACRPRPCRRARTGREAARRCPGTRVAAGGVRQAAPDEHLGGHALHPELGRERAHPIPGQHAGIVSDAGTQPISAPGRTPPCAAGGGRGSRPSTSTCRMRPSSSRSRGAGPW